MNEKYLREQFETWFKNEKEHLIDECSRTVIKETMYEGWKGCCYNQNKL